MKNARILFVVPCSPYFPSGIVRVEEYLPYFEASGVDYNLLNYNTPVVQRNLHWLDQSVFSKSALTDLVFRIIFHFSGIPYRWFRLLQILWSSKKYDIIFLQSILPPVWFSKLLAKLNKRIVFDYDDALYNRNVRRTQGIIRNVWRVVAGSQVLYDYARQYNPRVVLIPSSVPLQNYKSDENQGHHYPLRIGWIGGPSTLSNLRILEEPFRALVGKGLVFQILIAGSFGRQELIPKFEGVKKITVPVYQGDDIPELVASCDIGIMPLFDEPWERGKCAMKALICMAGGLPVVCSPVGEPEFIIRDGENGFLASSSQEWTEKLEALLNDAKLRMRVGKAGRETIEKGYSTEICFEALKREILDQAK
ncbi:MAG: glycosyltransferase family 4 protein [Methanosarcinaceae archaeon]